MECDALPEFIAWLESKYRESLLTLAEGSRLSLFWERLIFLALSSSFADALFLMKDGSRD